MSRYRPQFALAALGLTVLSGLGACNEQSRTFYGERQIDGATAALVNGEPIYVSDVEIEATAQGKIEPGDAFTAEHPAFQIVLDQLIDQRLLAQEATRRGLDLDPAARRRLEAGRERILGNILVESLVAGEVTEAAIDEMYAAQVELQQVDDQVRLRHILLETEDEAQSVLTDLEGGAVFAEVAITQSKDVRTRLDGGSFGWISPNNMLEPFPAMIGDTETGNLGGPFESEQGWHIIRVDERRTAPPKTKEEMRPEIITFLTFTQISEILSDLRVAADIRQLEEGEALPEPASLIEPDETFPDATAPDAE
ncbi:MAG: peptidylprolyl isomerase [Pseudomonadota bacterium]